MSNQQERARKVGGSYQADGMVVARFKTTAGLDRVVFEFDEPKGMLHIFNADQVVTWVDDEVPFKGSPVIEDALRAPDDATTPECKPERVIARPALQALGAYFHRVSDLWEGPDGCSTDGTVLCAGIARQLEALALAPMALGLTSIPPFPEGKA